MEEMKVGSVSVVMVPFLAYGHLIHFIRLSSLVSTYGLPVHFVSTPPNIRQVKTRGLGLDSLAAAKMHFHEITMPPLSIPPPDPHAPSTFPTYFVPMAESLMENFRAPFFSIVEKLSQEQRKIVVIYDSLMTHVVQDVGSIPNVESYCFSGTSAFAMFSFKWAGLGKPINVIPAEAERALKETPSFRECFGPEAAVRMSKLHEAPDFHSGVLFNSSRALDGMYLDLYAKNSKPVWAIGPFPVMMEQHDQQKQQQPMDGNRHKCLEWLDKQEERSVIFVCFGTASSLSDEQTYELALGLEKSEQKFVWALRDADKADVFQGEARKLPLPQGFEERVEGRGVIVRDWAPQLEILAHPSTGAFLSHSGWNSCLESIIHGVPMGTLPMHSDHPANSLFITQAVKVGTPLMDWARYRHGEVVSSTIVEKAVRKLMESEEGMEMRRRAVELGAAVRKAVIKDGHSGNEMDAFIRHITR